MQTAPAPVPADLSQWTTTEVAEAYIGQLRLRGSTDDPVVAPLQAEWARRPFKERLAALRAYRENLDRPHRAAFDLADWRDEVRA